MFLVLELGTLIEALVVYLLGGREAEDQKKVELNRKRTQSQHSHTRSSYLVAQARSIFSSSGRDAGTTGRTVFMHSNRSPER